MQKGVTELEFISSYMKCIVKLQCHHQTILEWYNIFELSITMNVREDHQLQKI